MFGKDGFCHDGAHTAWDDCQETLTWNLSRKPTCTKTTPTQRLCDEQKDELNRRVDNLNIAAAGGAVVAALCGIAVVGFPPSAPVTGPCAAAAGLLGGFWALESTYYTKLGHDPPDPRARDPRV